MKKITLLFFAIISLSFVEAQDYIITKKSDTVKVKIIEIGPTEIKYKKWNYLDGPNYTISKEAISKITYQNGDQEVYETDNVAPKTTLVEKSNQQPKSYNSSMISQLSNTKSSRPANKCDTCYKYEKFNFSMYIGPAFSVGKFGQTSEDNFSAIYSYGTTSSPELYCGAASKAGGIFGFNLHFPIFKKNHHEVGVNLKNDIHFNTISQQEKEDFEKYEVAFWQAFSNEYYNIPYGVNAYQWMVGRYSTYWNYALKLEFDYTHYFNKKVALMLIGGVGLQLNMVSKTKLLNMMGGSYITTEYVEEYGQYARMYSSDGMYYKYKPACSFVYELGAGVLLGDIVSLSVLYSAGSPHKHNMEVVEYSSKKLQGDFTPISFFSRELKVQYIALQVSFHF